MDKKKLDNFFEKVKAEQEVAEEKPKEEEGEKTEESKEKKKKYILIGAILGAGVLVWYFLRKKETGFGVCIHGSHYAGLSDMKKMGASIIRDDIEWASIESQKGIFRFKDFDKRINQILSAGLQPLLIIDYSNPIYSEPPVGTERTWVYVPPEPEKFEIFKKAYGEYVYQVVKNYKGKVKYFEIWNEPDGFWEPKYYPEVQIPQYVALMEEAYTRAKEANPNCVILSAGLGTWFPYFEPWYRKICENGHFDVLAIHPYCQPNSPYSTEMDNIKKIRNIMIEYGQEKKMWITEFGYPTEGKPFYKDEKRWCYTCKTVNEKTTADYLKLFFYRIFNEFPYIKKVFWYDYKDDCEIRGENLNPIDSGCPDPNEISEACPIWTECRFGLTHYDFTPKPAWYAFREMSRKYRFK